MQGSSTRIGVACESPKPSKPANAEPRAAAPSTAPKLRVGAGACEKCGLGPGRRWLVRYELEAGREAAADSQPHPIGAFGINESGIVDMAGNVWEWTSTCFTHHILDRNDAD
ncbi:MAG: SUMF1/EgtB/PvdO family nonheme iron enzyme, partial [Alphaproteobacteria bacterium]|nr:SUMF1/EgtB/PvdO family nonheme iron enzyme [Alphaproteobacteria bacterium]